MIRFEAGRLHLGHIAAICKWSYPWIAAQSCTKDFPAASVHAFKHGAVAAFSPRGVS